MTAGQAAGTHVVRLRMRTHAWTSPGMPLVDAETLAADLTIQVAGLGGSYAFVTFRGRDGRVFEVRAREVMAVEVSPEGHVDLRPRHTSAAASTGGATSGTVQVYGSPAPESGTSWLRQRSADRRVPLGGPR